MLGTLAGEALRIDDRLNGLSGLVERRLHLSGFAQSFVNGALIYCVGAMAIIGALNDGLRGDASVLYIKSLLDGISSVVLGATLGPGVIFAALPVLVYPVSYTHIGFFFHRHIAGTQRKFESSPGFGEPLEKFHRSLNFLRSGIRHNKARALLHGKIFPALEFRAWVGAHRCV